MSDLIGLVKNAIAYDEHQIGILKMHIDLMKLWTDWGENLVSFLREYKAVQDKPDRVVISVDRIRKALVNTKAIKHRHLVEHQYEELRGLAFKRQFARFTAGQTYIEFAKPIISTNCITDFSHDDVRIIDHEVGDMANGMDIGCSPGNYIWASCPNCGKQEWCKLTKNGMPESWRCADCNLLKRQRRSSGSAVNGAGYILVRIMETDFFYPMANRIGYIPEHRLVMANHLKRCLQPWEIVHHKNGHKGDNRLDNLELVPSIGEHAANHNTGYEGGYKHGLVQWSAKVKQLEERIAELEDQLDNSGGKS